MTTTWEITKLEITRDAVTYRADCPDPDNWSEVLEEVDRRVMACGDEEIVRRWEAAKAAGNAPDAPDSVDGHVVELDGYEDLKDGNCPTCGLEIVEGYEPPTPFCRCNQN